LADAVGERFQNKQQLTIDNLPAKAMKESMSTDNAASKAASAA
jgi:hypothetical protein